VSAAYFTSMFEILLTASVANFIWRILCITYLYLSFPVWPDCQ